MSLEGFRRRQAAHEAERAKRLSRTKEKHAPAFRLTERHVVDPRTHAVRTQRVVPPAWDDVEARFLHRMDQRAKARQPVKNVFAGALSHALEPSVGGTDPHRDPQLP